MPVPRQLLSAILAVVMVVTSNASAQSVSELTDIVKKLSDALANSQLTSQGSSLLSQFGNVGTGLGADQAKDLVIEFTAKVASGNIPAQLAAMYDQAQQAKAAVAHVNTNLDKAPDYSHLNYCAQAKTSADQIARIEVAIEKLNKLAYLAGSFKIILLGIDSLHQRLESLFAKLTIAEAAQLKAPGANYEMWEFFFRSDGSEDDPSAAWYTNTIKTIWDDVETQANDKAQKLRTLLDARKAFDQHFYSAAEQKCSDDAALAAALATFEAPLPGSVIPAGGGPPDACQMSANRALTAASSCMQQTTVSMCATFMKTARCYSMAASQCGACPCGSQLQSAATQARQSAAAICAQ